LHPTIGGHARTVIVHLPAGYSARKPLPLVLNLHGSTSTAAQEETFSGMDGTADASSFVVAYPQGDIPSAWGFDWNVPNDPAASGGRVRAGAPDDVAFLVGLVSILQHRYCIDSRRIFATGFSGGARMISQLGCRAASTFAAIAPVSGLRMPAPCHSSRPMPVIAFHGTADLIVPYNGYAGIPAANSIPGAAQGWAQHDGCSQHPARSRPAPSVTLTRYRGCRAGAMVELYTISGEGHEWPGGPPMPGLLTAVLGPQSSAVDADTVIWTFFQQHARKG
jgi:polyhydroxybutyrate depolymerase